MKRIAKHFGALVVVLFFCSFSYSNAQVVGTQPSPNSTYITTPNLLNPTVNSWTGTVQGQNGGFSGGNTPAFNPTTNTIIFGYTTATTAQTMAINQALSGTGIQVGGYNYSWSVNNDPASGQYGTLTGQVVLKDAVGNALQTYNYNYPQQSGGFINFSGTQWFPQDYTLANLSTLELSFTGKDARFWAGYYGPQVRNPTIGLQYTVDPCAGNPRYSPSCAGYSNSDMWYSGDLTSVYGSTFAINQALGFGNTGVRVHSVNWGYDYNIGGNYCSGFSLIGICFAWSDSYVGGALAITDNNANTILTDSNHTSGQNISGSFRREILLGSTSRDISTLGAASISTYTGGIAAVTPYMGFNFTPDICNTNPLTSSQCPGYAQAFFTQQCTANALYDTSCPGYAQAFFTQQCTANALYDTSCPGYAAAYLTQQCNANPLYSPSCPGYAQAYLNQQCSINPLYDSKCSNYQTATTQCNANPLYAAYCPGYTTAVNQCATNGLLYNYCPTYQTELNYCSTDPLFNNLCPTYQTATASCSANALSQSYCPGYQSALNTCSTNPMSNTLCSGYTAANNACTANSLTYTYCPSYTTTLSSCGSNPQSNTMCPGYSTTKSASIGGSSKVSVSEPTVAVSSSGKVETNISKTGDSSVDSVVDRQATSASPSDTTATVKLTPSNSNSQSPSSTAGPAMPMAAASSKEDKKKEGAKTEVAPSGQGPATRSAGSSDAGDKDKPKTARQEIQEKREAAAKEKAVEQGKQLANKMGEAATMEAQIAVQNVVIQAMGFTPGFDSYGRVMLPDTQGYRPFEIYPGQRNIDTPSGRRLMTGSDRLHSEMIDQQYKMEK
jgi:hypothetical protein